MAQGPFPAEGFPLAAPAQARTLGEYRQEILKGLSCLSNDDLGLLLACYFPDLDHVQDAKKNRMSILLAPLLVSEIWTRVNQFLTSHALPPLAGEPPPLDLGNWSGRTLLSELPSAVSTPSASWPVVMSVSSEITLPTSLAQVAAAAATAAVTAAEPANQAARLRPPAPPRSLLMLGGLAGLIALLAVHVCPFIRHGLRSPKSDRLLSQETQLAQYSPPARLVLIPVALPALRQSSRHHGQRDPQTAGTHHGSRHHGARSAAQQGLDGQVVRQFSPPTCSFTYERRVHGELKSAPVQRTILLPPELQPGSAAAKRWAQAACARARRELLRGR